MNTILLGEYGALEFKADHWERWEVRTPIGLVDLQVDAGADLGSEVSDCITSVLDQFTKIDTLAREYLSEHAAEDVALARELHEPSLLFGAEESRGTFTLFYSGEDSDDDTCYGVEFRDYMPFDLTIGD